MLPVPSAGKHLTSATRLIGKKNIQGWEDRRHVTGAGRRKTEKTMLVETVSSFVFPLHLIILPLFCINSETRCYTQRTYLRHLLFSFLSGSDAGL